MGVRGEGKMVEGETMKRKIVKASDCKCCQCENEAVAFWPCDPDIPDHPYCRKCLDEAKLRVLSMISEIAT